MTEAAPALATDFVRALASRDYGRAYAMTSEDYRAGASQAEMQAAFEAVIPLDWGDTEPIEIGLTMSDWPGKQSDDVGYVFVSIYGDVYSEGVSVVVASGGDSLVIRGVEWGRP